MRLTVFLVAAAVAVGAKAADIHVAVRAGDIKRVEALLKHDPQLLESQANQYRTTPLHIAAHDEQMEIAKLLVSRGAKLEAPDKDLATPAFLAALRGSCNVLAFLLKSGANPNAIADEGVRPLHVAAMNGHVACAAALLDAGANPNVRDIRGTSPLSFAQNLRNQAIIQLLKSRGAK